MKEKLEKISNYLQKNRLGIFLEFLLWLAFAITYLKVILSPFVNILDGWVDTLQFGTPESYCFMIAFPTSLFFMFWLIGNSADRLQAWWELREKVDKKKENEKIDV